MSSYINLTKRLFLNTLAKIGIKKKYKIGNTYLKLDVNHLLSVYQACHPYYDRFLPHLCNFLEKGSVVVDVGANVGDTLVGMWDQNPNLKFVCIEADIGFYNDLLSNIDRLVRADPQAKIYPVNKFVGSAVSNVSLIGSGGTKHAVEGGGIVSESLDTILADLNLDSKVSLLKTDVDGFDYDVINSASKITDNNIKIYFECQYETDTQLNGYKNLLRDLVKIGYTKFAIFDNFGQFIATFGETKEMFELLDYVMRQNKGRSTRTFYYFDILAYGANDENQIAEVINSYLQT